MNNQNNYQINQGAINFQSQYLSDKQALEKFVDDLIKEKNSPHVNDTNRAQVKEMLLREITAAINRRLINELTDEQVKNLNQLLEKKVSDEDLGKFFSQNIPNLVQVITEVLFDFRRGYLSVVYPK